VAIGDGKRFSYTMDIKSLYTVIPNNDGLLALAPFLDKREVKEPSTVTLIGLAELVVTLSAFRFNGDQYRQVSGVAVGSKMGPNYACLLSVQNQLYLIYLISKMPCFKMVIREALLTTTLMMH